MVILSGWTARLLGEEKRKWQKWAVRDEALMTQQWEDITHLCLSELKSESHALQNTNILYKYSCNSLFEWPLCNITICNIWILIFMLVIFTRSYYLPLDIISMSSVVSLKLLIHIIKHNHRGDKVNRFPRWEQVEVWSTVTAPITITYSQSRKMIALN